MSTSDCLNFIASRYNRFIWQLITQSFQWYFGYSHLGLLLEQTNNVCAPVVDLSIYWGIWQIASGRVVVGCSVKVHWRKEKYIQNHLWKTAQQETGNWCVKENFRKCVLIALPRLWIATCVYNDKYFNFSQYYNNLMNIKMTHAANLSGVPSCRINLNPGFSLAMRRGRSTRDGSHTWDCMMYRCTNVSWKITAPLTLHKVGMVDQESILIKNGQSDNQKDRWSASLMRAVPT